MFENYPDVLTVSQMRKALQIGQSKAYELVHSGDLRFITIGRQIRVPKTYLLDYMETMCSQSQPGCADLPEGGLAQ